MKKKITIEILKDGEVERAFHNVLSPTITIEYHPDPCSLISKREFIINYDDIAYNDMSIYSYVLHNYDVKLYEYIGDLNITDKNVAEYLKELSDKSYLMRKQDVVRDIRFSFGNHTFTFNSCFLTKVCSYEICSIRFDNYFEVPKKEQYVSSKKKKCTIDVERLKEQSYQCAYDLSNDWAKEVPDWTDVQKAYELGYRQGFKDKTKKKV